MLIAIKDYLVNKSVEIPKVIIFKNLEDIPKSDTFFFSSITDCTYLQTEMYGIVKYFNLSILDWLGLIKDKYLNFDGYFKQVCQLTENDIGNFCRSNAGNTSWSGQVLKDKYDLNFLQTTLPADTLVYLSTAKQIDQIIRLWYINNTCISAINYSLNSSVEYLQNYDEYIQYANNVALDYEPDEMYVIDLCKFNNKIYVVEYNCFSTAEFYNADIKQITDAVQEYFKNQ